MKAFIPTSISLIGGLASHFCLFATPSMTPTVSSEPLSTESLSRICQQQSSIRVTSPRTFPNHGIDFEEFWQQRFRVFDRMQRYGGRFMASLADTLNCADRDNAFAIYHCPRITQQISKYCDGGIFDDAA